MMKKLMIAPLCLLALSCGNNNSENATNIENEQAFCSLEIDENAGSACNVEFGGITFTRALNGADSLVTIQDDGKMRFIAHENADFFCDPNEQLTNNSAPVLLTEIDNTKPFRFTAKVSPEFTQTGLYNAGVLYVYANDAFWQKFCFEQDERGKHRIVSVRTMGTSDDNNHDVISQDWAYLRLFSDTRTLAFYYSLDGTEWQMVRLYKNNFPKRVFLGISNQCPKDKNSSSIFEEVSISTDNVKDIRMGN